MCGHHLNSPPDIFPAHSIFRYLMTMNGLSVGTKYKKEGRIEAILEGIRLSGPSMHSKLEQGIKLSRQGKLLVHCWRGGMRSEAMAWLFSLADIETEILEGGYKSYRHFILDSLSVNRKMIILGGLTGSGKTQY